MEDILRQLFYGDYVPFEILTELNGSKKSDRGDVTTQLKALVQPEQFGLIEKHGYPFKASFQRGEKEV